MPGTQMADGSTLAALYSRCKTQDRTAFAELFERYAQRVYRSAFFITHRHDAAEEITQLVFVELFGAFRRFDLNRPFLPWLYRIVHDVSMDYLRRDRRGTHSPLPHADWQLDALLGADPAPNPAERAEQTELREILWQAIEQLPAKQRAVLVLRYYSDLNEGELAEALGCRRGTVKSRLHRAHRALAEILHTSIEPNMAPPTRAAIEGQWRVALAQE
jgi:RNA polymerase sigma-70 factor (ECF subfamily)